MARVWVARRHARSGEPAVGSKDDLFDAALEARMSELTDAVRMPARSTPSCPRRT